MWNPPVKLLDRVRQSIRLKGYSIRTEKSYVSWVKRFVLFHGKRHPQEMGKVEIEAFLSHLVMKRNVAYSTQNQAFNAILFLYNHDLHSCSQSWWQRCEKSAGHWEMTQVGPTCIFTFNLNTKPQIYPLVA